MKISSSLCMVSTRHEMPPWHSLLWRHSSVHPRVTRWILRMCAIALHRPLARGASSASAPHRRPSLMPRTPRTGPLPWAKHSTVTLISHGLSVWLACGDKDELGILQALEPFLSEVVITQNTSPRALDA